MQSYMTAERKSGSTVGFKGEKSVSKVHVLYFKTSPYQDIGHELLTVHNSV